MYKKIILTLLAFVFFVPQFVFCADVHPCRTAWNNKMQEYDDQYLQGLNNLLYQKERTSSIIDSQAVSYNLRSHNCRMHQICELVNYSLNPDEKNSANKKVVGKMMRCQPTYISEFGGVFAECSNQIISDQSSTFSLWSTCVEQAEDRIEKIEITTELEIIKNNAAKKTSNLVQYLTKLNKKLDTLAIDTGDLIGILFDVTRKMTCVQKSCN